MTKTSLRLAIVVLPMIFVRRGTVPAVVLLLLIPSFYFFESDHDVELASSNSADLIGTSSSPQSLEVTTCATGGVDISPNVTDRIEELGNPTYTRFRDPTLRYARNVWTLHRFGKRIYIGSGNSSNSGPASNAGQLQCDGKPGTDIWAYDLLSEKFLIEGRISEEQIERFRTIEGKLTIPGHDTTEASWDYGFFYQRQMDGTWTRQSIPNGVHVYDIIEYDASLHAGLGSDGKNSAMVRRPLQQADWQPMSVPDPIPATPMVRPTRIYGFFELDHALMASTTPMVALEPSPKLLGNLVRYRQGRWELLSGEALFIGIGEQPLGSVRLERSVVFKDKTVGLSATAWNDHQWLPLSVIIAHNLQNSAEVPIPNDALPYDVKIHDDFCYVLTNVRLNDSDWRIAVMRSGDLTRWETLFHFHQETFARSFEFVGRDIYFGLGSEFVEIEDTSKPAVPSDSTGMIVRLQDAI